jgi:hypothetical protein
MTLIAWILLTIIFVILGVVGLMMNAMDSLLGSKKTPWISLTLLVIASGFFIKSIFVALQ